MENVAKLAVIYLGAQELSWWVKGEWQLSALSHDTGPEGNLSVVCSLLVTPSTKTQGIALSFPVPSSKCLGMSSWHLVNCPFDRDVEHSFAPLHYHN